MPGLRFRLLGPATVTDDGGTPVRVSATKGFAVLCYLAMNLGRPVRRADLADLLWGDRVDVQARQNLRQAIFTIRRDLGPVAGQVLSVGDQSLVLTPGAVEVDALQFAAWADSSDPALQARCLDMPWGAFLDRFESGAEPFDQWVAAERSRFEAIAGRVFSALADRAEQAGDGGRAVQAMERLIAVDPTEEERHRRLLSLEARYNGIDAALARAKHLASVLKRELDAEPEPATLALIENLRQSAGAIRPDMRRAPEAIISPPTLPAPASATSSRVRPIGRRLQFAGGLAAAALVGSIILAGLGMPDRRAPSAEASSRLADDPSWFSPGAMADASGSGRSRGVVAIAVLPFTSLGEQGEAATMLAAMATDDLTDVLSRISTFRVISRQTAATYAGQAVDAAALGSELGIRYLLEGSVSTRGDIVRVNVSLIDVKTRAHVWSGRFERSGAERHAMQDEIVNSLARELQIEVGRIESNSGPGEPDLHALVFKGWRAIDAAGRSGVAPLYEAEKHFRQVLDRDPGNLRAQLGLAAFHTHMAVQLYAPEPTKHITAALAILNPTLERHPNLSSAHATMGLLSIARQQFAEAERWYQQSVALNPSHAGSYAQLGRLLLRKGRPQDALEHVRYAMRLSPRDPLQSYWLGFAGAAELELMHFDKAVAYLEQALAINPGQPRTTLVLVAAHALAGNMPAARATLASLQAKLPHLSSEKLLQRFGAPAASSRFMQGLTLAMASSTP